MKKKLFSRKLRWKLFKTRVSHLKWLLEIIKLIKICIVGIFYTSCPTNDKQRERLILYVDTYDKMIRTLETDIIGRAREICNIKDESN